MVRPHFPRRICQFLVAACFLPTISLNLLAAPQGMAVVAGSAAVLEAGKRMEIATSNNAILNWRSFSIAADESLRFNQPGAASAVLNRVSGGDPSLILGQLSSNGLVYLVNPAGILVGNGARIDVAGLVASTLNLGDGDFLAGRLRFTETPGAGSLTINGSVTAADGGQVILVAPRIENAGSVQARGGSIVLAAGERVELHDTRLPGIRAELSGEGSVVSVGRLLAESGQIGIFGAALRNAGAIDAASAVSEGGRIFLRASRSIELASGSSLRSDGTQGGQIVARVEADGQIAGTLFADGSISARGGAGGFVETSALATRFASGFNVDTGGGWWLIDPVDFTIAAGTAPMDASGIGADTLAGILQNGSVSIRTDAATSGNGDLRVEAPVFWSSNSSLSLQAHRDIALIAGLGSSGSGEIALSAGRDVRINSVGGQISTPLGSVAISAANGAIIADSTLSSAITQPRLVGSGSAQIVADTATLSSGRGIYAGDIANPSYFQIDVRALRATHTGIATGWPEGQMLLQVPETSSQVISATQPTQVPAATLPTLAVDDVALAAGTSFVLIAPGREVLVNSVRGEAASNASFIAAAVRIDGPVVAESVSLYSDQPVSGSGSVTAGAVWFGRNSVGDLLVGGATPNVTTAFLSRISGANTLGFSAYGSGASVIVDEALAAPEMSFVFSAPRIELRQNLSVGSASFYSEVPIAGSGSVVSSGYISFGRYATGSLTIGSGGQVDPADIAGVAPRFQAPGYTFAAYGDGSSVVVNDPLDLPGKSLSFSAPGLSINAPVSAGDVWLASDTPIAGTATVTASNWMNFSSHSTSDFTVGGADAILAAADLGSRFIAPAFAFMNWYDNGVTRIAGDLSFPDSQLEIYAKSIDVAANVLIAGKEINLTTDALSLGSGALISATAVASSSGGYAGLDGGRILVQAYGANSDLCVGGQPACSGALNLSTQLLSGLQADPSAPYGGLFLNAYGGDIRITGDVPGVYGRTHLVGNSVVQEAGVLEGSFLAYAFSGDINLGGANRISYFGGYAQNGGSINVNTLAPSLTVGTTVADRIALSAPAGGIFSEGGAQLIAASSLTLAAATGIDVVTQTPLYQSIVNTGSGEVVLENLSYPDSLLLGRLENAGGGISLENYGGIVSGGDAIRAAGDVTLLAHSPISIGSGGIVSAGGGVSLVAGGDASTDPADVIGIDGTLSGSSIYLAGNSLSGSQIPLGPNVTMNVSVAPAVVTTIGASSTQQQQQLVVALDTTAPGSSTSSTGTATTSTGTSSTSTTTGAVTTTTSTPLPTTTASEGSPTQTLEGGTIGNSPGEFGNSSESTAGSGQSTSGTQGRKNGEAPGKTRRSRRQC